MAEKFRSEGKDGPSSFPEPTGCLRSSWQQIGNLLLYTAAGVKGSHKVTTAARHLLTPEKRRRWRPADCCCLHTLQCHVECLTSLSSCSGCWVRYRRLHYHHQVWQSLPHRTRRLEVCRGRGPSRPRSLNSLLQLLTWDTFQYFLSFLCLI